MACPNWKDVGLPGGSGECLDQRTRYNGTVGPCVCAQCPFNPEPGKPGGVSRLCQIRKTQKAGLPVQPCGGCGGGIEMADVHGKPGGADAVLLD